MILATHDLARRITTIQTDQPAVIERSRAEKIRVALRSDYNVAATLGADAQLLFTLKEKGHRNADPLLQVTLTVADLRENTEDTYEQTDVDAITEAINTLLGVSAGEDNTITSKTCEGHFSYRASEDDEWQDGAPFDVTLNNTPRNEEDDTPLQVPVGFIRYVRPVVGLTGGGSTKLDGLVTVDLDAGTLVSLVDDSASSVLRVYELVAGTDAESSPNVIRPDDYHVSTNAKVWKLRNPSSGGTWGSITGTLSGQADLQAALDAKIPTSYLDTDGTLAANSDTKIATQKAVKTLVAASVAGLLDFKGSTDASANPNYPSASKGDAYMISVAGKIGGSSGKVVSVGDMVIASADNAGGTEASVGASWFVLEANIPGITSAGVAMIQAATAAAQTALLSAVVGDSGSGGTKGLVPAPSAGDAAAGKFLKADGTFAVPSGGSSSVATGKVLWLDATNGNNGTAVAGRLDKPYLTPAAARDAASSGDTICVLPGAYTARGSMLKDGVNWFFFPGAKLTRTYNPTQATATLAVSGFDMAEHTLQLSEQITGGVHWDVEFIDTDASPAGEPSSGNGVVYFTTAASDAEILAALLSAIATGTGSTPAATPNTGGTASPWTPSGSNLTSIYKGAPVGFRRTPTNHGISFTSVVDGVNDSGAENTGGLWDDRGSAKTSRIEGFGEFVVDASPYVNSSSSSVLGAVRLAAASAVTVDCRLIRSIGGDGIATIITGVKTTHADSQCVVRATDGITIVDAPAEHSSAVWWEDGELAVSGRTLSGNTGIYYDVSGGSTKNMFINAELIYGTKFAAWGKSGAGAAGVWVDAKIMKTAADIFAFVLWTKTGSGHECRSYFNVQKLFGQCYWESGVNYIRAMKHSALIDGSALIYPSDPALLFYECDHVDHAGFANVLVLELVGGSGNEYYITIRRFVGNSSSIGSTIGASGKVYLSLKHFDLSANASESCIEFSLPGELHLQDCTLYGHAGQYDLEGTGDAFIVGGRGSGTNGAMRINAGGAVFQNADPAQWTPAAGFTANDDAGDASQVIPNAGTVSGLASTLDGVASGAGTLLLQVAEKVKALETALASKQYPTT